MRKASLAVALVGFLVGCGNSAGKFPMLDQSGSTDGVANDLDAAAEDRGRSPEAWEEYRPEEDFAPPDERNPDDGSVPEEVVPEVEPGDVPIAPDVPNTPEVTPEIEQVDVVLPDLSKEGDDCLTIIKCGILHNCNVSDDACWNQCRTTGSDMGLWEFNLVMDCFDQGCYGLPQEQEGQCLWDKCGMNLFVCAGGEGEGDCGEALDCLLACPENDGICPLECMALADEEAIKKALALVYSGPGPDGANSFFWLLECVGGQGTGSCSDLITCMGECPKDGEDDGGECAIACMKAASQEAVDQWKESMSCGDQPCFDKLILCMGGQGDLSCGEAFNCMNECEAGGGGDTCFQQCMTQLSPEGVPEVIAFFECVNEKCGGNPENCPAAMACLPLCPGLQPPGQ